MLIEPSRDAGNESGRHKNGRENQRDTDYRAGELLHRFSGRILRSQTLFDVALHAFHDDDGVVHHQPMASTRPNSESVLMENPNSGKDINVPTSETGTASSGISVARQSCRKR